MNLFINILAEDPQYFFSWIIVIVFSICVHEWAHAATAYRCGDDTAAREGHLTLNPMVQMGPMSLIFLAIIGIAWGAVPVDVSLLRKRVHEPLVAFAGPASNLILSILFSLVAVILGVMGDGSHPVQRFFVLGSVANGVLFVLNMLPVPVLDGWKIYAHWIPAMKWMPRDQAMMVSNVFLILIFLTPLGGQIWHYGETVGGLFIAVWRGLFALLHLA